MKLYRKCLIYLSSPNTLLIALTLTICLSLYALSSIKNVDKCITKNDASKLIIVYNRLPKTGSTTVMNVVYQLSKRNHFSVVLTNVTRNQHTLSLQDQYRLVQNITGWTDRHPLFLHGHLAYLDFARFGADAIYLQLVREPLDRFVSYYYFLRCGDDLRPNVVRSKAGDNRTLDECVAQNDRDCSPDKLWLQVPFFCGQARQCWEPGNRWALDEAKRNFIDKYFLVGTTEQLEQFVHLLQLSLPRIFAGAIELLKAGNSHVRRTVCKRPPEPATLQRIQESSIYRMERHFYDFVHQTFDQIYKRSIKRPTELHFDKIRPVRVSNGNYDVSAYDIPITGN